MDWTVNDLVFNQSKVKAHANRIPEHIERANIVKTLGIVTGRTRTRNAQHRNNRWAVGCANQGPPIVDVYDLAIPARLTEDQIVDGSSDEVGISEIVLAGVFELPDGSRCNASYWLPPDFPKTENWELEVQPGKGYTDMHVSYIEPLPFALDELYLPVVLEDMMELAENSVALANQVYANELKELARKTSVTSELALVSLAESQTVEGRQWKLKAKWKNVPESAMFKQIWRSETPVKIYGDEKIPDAEAEGSIFSVESLGNHEFDVVVTLISYVDEKSRVDAFDLLVGSKQALNVRVTPCVMRILSRAECWSEGKPSRCARELSDRGRIMAALLGLTHSHPLTVPVVDENEFDRERVLNEEQLQTFRYAVSSEACIIHQPAPGGTGKTNAVVITVIELLKRFPSKTVVFTTRCNLALKRLVMEAVPLLGEEKCMVVLSAPAKAEYAADFAPYRQHLLVHTAEQLLEDMRCETHAERERDQLAQYVTDCEKRPRRARERTALNVVKRRKRLPRVFFATMAMLEDLSQITDRADYMIVDEAGQSAIDQTANIVCAMPNLQCVVFTGDECQLLNYVAEVPEDVRDFGTESMLTYLHRLSDLEICRVVLVKTYRFHPAIAACVAATGYGDQLVCAIEKEKRTMITSAPLSFPVPDFPVLLLHQEDEDSKDSETTSRYNEGQESAALSILVEILERLPSSARVVVVCLYTTEKDRMREEVKKRNWTSVKVHSADGFQANEADLVYILTTRSTPVADSLLRLIREKVLDFIRDERRATVALSRAREGVILHGNLKTMCTGEAWRGFVLEALRGTKIVSPDAYLAALESGTDPETLTLPPWTLGVTESGFTRGHPFKSSPPTASHPSRSESHQPQCSSHSLPNILPPSRSESPLPSTSGSLPIPTGAQRELDEQSDR